jgi:hypothetical protein
MRVLASKLLVLFFVELALEPFGRLKAIVSLVKLGEPEQHVNVCAVAFLPCRQYMHKNVIKLSGSLLCIS